MRGQRRGPPRPEPPPAQPRQGRDAGDLGDLRAVDLHRVVRADRDRFAVLHRDHHDRAAGGDPLAQHGGPRRAEGRTDRRADRRAAGLRARAGVGEGDRRQPLVARQLGVVGTDQVEPDAVRQQQLDRVRGHQQRGGVHGQAGGTDGGLDGGRVLAHPLHRHRQVRGLLERHGRPDVVGGDLLPRARPGRVGPRRAADRHVQAARGLDPRIRQRRRGEVPLDACEQAGRRGHRGTLDGRRSGGRSPAAPPPLPHPDG